MKRGVFPPLLFKPELLIVLMLYEIFIYCLYQPLRTWIFVSVIGPRDSEDPAIGQPRSVYLE